MLLNCARNYIYTQKYVTSEDASKYQKLEVPQFHAPPAQGLLEDGDHLFGGLHHHFRRRMQQLLAREPEAPQSEVDNGLHIQLTRRSVHEE